MGKLNVSGDVNLANISCNALTINGYFFKLAGSWLTMDFMLPTLTIPRLAVPLAKRLIGLSYNVRLELPS